MQRTLLSRVIASLLSIAAIALLGHSELQAEEAGTRLKIVDRSIEYHGGSTYGSSESRLRQCSKGGCFRIVSRNDGGFFDHDVSRESGGLRVRVTNDLVEMWRDGSPVPVADDQKQRWRDWVSQRVYFPFLPYHLNDDSVYKEDLGMVEWDGESFHLVKVRFDEGTSSSSSSEYLYWFAPDTARLEQYAYSFEGGLRFRVAFNFQRVGGILFADNENHGIDGRGLTVDLIDESYVENEMTHISTVRLEDIGVRPLE